MAIKSLIFIKRKAGTFSESFQKYYEEYHAPLAMNIVGSRFAKYVRNYLEPGTADQLGFDVVTEIWFKDQEQYDGFFADMKVEEDGEGRIAASEEKFIDRKEITWCVVNEVATEVGAGGHGA